MLIKKSNKINTNIPLIYKLIDQNKLHHLILKIIIVIIIVFRLLDTNSSIKIKIIKNAMMNAVNLIEINKRYKI